MDYKIRGYQQFNGKYLQTNVKVSQKVVDTMNDYDLQKMRELCTNFEKDMMKLLHFYADTLACEEMNQTTPCEDEQTNTEKQTETSTEFTSEPSRKKLKL